MPAKKVTKKTEEAPKEPIEMAVCLFEGIQFADFDLTEEHQVSLVLQTGRTGECEACGGVMFTSFFEGSWLCYADIEEQAKEMRLMEQEEDAEEDF